MYEQDETMAHPTEMVDACASEETEEESICSGTGPSSGGESETAEDGSPKIIPETSAQSADSTAQVLGADQEDRTELECLRRELNLLREQLHGQAEELKRIGLEYAEFCDLYPDISTEELPDQVWENVRRGIPLSAAYALAERRRLRTEEKARLLNEKNRNRSCGAIENASSGYLSPDEVRAMSQAEVRANYQNILLSMQKWR